jgi:hypothetical protein
LNVVRALVEELGVQKSDSRRRCFFCSHTTRGPKHETKTSYECKECNVGLCVVPCFEAYHTLKHF